MTLILASLWLGTAHAGEPAVRIAVRTDPSEVAEQELPPAAPPETVLMDFGAISAFDLVLWAAEQYGTTFVVPDAASLRSETLTIVSHHAIPYETGWTYVVDALREAGWAVVRVGDTARVVPLAEVSGQPLPVSESE